MTDHKTILVVDDDIDILDQLTATLSKAGYQVVSADGQERAEEALLKSRPDLVVCDLMMDELDSGFVICHRVKKLYPDTPIIMLTAVTSSTGLSFSPRTAGQRAWVKADVLMHKPVPPAQLTSTVEQLLARAARPGTAGRAREPDAT